jgi:hypothetical protein
MTQAIARITQDILDHRGEPMAIIGLWGQHWQVLQEARAAGVADGEFTPPPLVFGSGGTKGNDLPHDYREQVWRFYGVTSHPVSYGMAELSSGFPRCPAGRYHQTPWVAVLLLDETGERLEHFEGGEAIGRAAFFDIALTGRWGGVVSADRIEVRRGHCDCGRTGVTIADKISRFVGSSGADDKLSCAGTMDAYIRGELRD